MTSHTTALELIEALSQHDPSTPVLLPTLGPPDSTKSQNGHDAAANVAVTAQTRDGVRTLLIGDHRQAAAEYPELEGTAVYIHALIRHRAALGELTGTTDVSLPKGPIIRHPQSAADHDALQRITNPHDDARARSATVLQGLPEETGQQPLLPAPVYLLILTVEHPVPEDAKEAAQRAKQLQSITATTVQPVVAAIYPPLEWPNKPAAPLHILEWAERRCPTCDRSFRTARGLRIHLMLEAGTAENQPKQQRYWQRYMDDLRQLAEEIPHNFQEHPAYKPSPQPPPRR